jgi:hypothetical protein
MQIPRSVDSACKRYKKEERYEMVGMRRGQLREKKAKKKEKNSLRKETHN